MKDLTQFRLFFRFLKVLLPYRNRYLAIVALSGLSSLVSLVNPYLAKLVIDEAIGNKNLSLFIVLTLIGAGVFILRELSDGAKDFLNRYVNSKVNFDLKRMVFKHIQSFSLGWFQDKSTGEHIYKINEDADTVSHFITETPPQSIAIFPRLLITLAIVLYLNWKMAFLSLCLAPLLYLPPYYFSRRMRKVWKVLMENSEEIFKHLEESFSHIQVIKAFGKETASIRKYLKSLIANIRIGLKNIRLEIFSAFTSQAANRIVTGLITFYGGYMVIRGEMSLGSFTAIMVYLAQLIGLQGQFAYFFQSIAQGTVSCQRLTEILDRQPDLIEAKDAKTVVFKNARINFENVSFGYRPQEYILKDISFSVEPGSHIALVGPSGCGKTTLLGLILRLYDPWQGRVLIDDYDIKDLKVSALKEQIGIALQESFLWNDTIENNIRYARQDADREEIIRIAELTGVDEFVRNLPKGYQTIIGENACKLSEGQKQKVAIARVVLKVPKILIMDEAMSSMDSASEEKIMLNIRGTLGNATLITVSHRLSTVMSADLVYFLSGPNEMTIDKPQNLLENNRKFFDLFAGQGKILVYE